MFSASKVNLRHHVALATAWFLIGVVLVHGGPASAQGNEPWRVKGKLIGKPKGNDVLDSKKSKDVSGIACGTTTSFPRICLLADDETQGAQIVILREGGLVAGDFIRLIDNVHKGKLIELDAEGVAYADGYFYVIGSHGRPRHEADAEEEAKNKAKAEASRHVFRIRFDLTAVNPDNGRLTGSPEIKRSTELSQFIKDEPKLASWFDKALDDNGLTIEGVAVRDGRLYAGMRGPVLDDGNAVILSAPLAALFDGQRGNAQLHRVNLGKDNLNKVRGVRDLVAFETGFLLLAGPVNDPPKGKVNLGDYSVYWWDGDISTKLLKPLEAYGDKVKPEALVPLDRRDKKLRVLLFFDGPDEGEPRPVEVDEP